AQKAGIFENGGDLAYRQWRRQLHRQTDHGVELGAYGVEPACAFYHLILLGPLNGTVEAFRQTLGDCPELRPLDLGERAIAIGKQHRQLHRHILFARTQTGAMATAFAFGEDTHRFAADPPDGVSGRVQLVAGHRLREANIDDHLGGRVNFFWIVGLIILGLRRDGGGQRPEAGLAPHWSGRRGSRPQKRVHLTLRKTFLHLLAYAPVLPPVEQQHQQNEYDPQKDQADLKITHFQPR